MDYKYILQLLDLYWKGDTSLEEEDILHIFFSQENIPAELEQYRQYFAYARNQREESHLDSDFDARMLALVGEEKPRQSRSAYFKSRMMPLFRAVAIVAVVLTLSNAAQLPFHESPVVPTIDGNAQKGTTAVVEGDSITTDSLRQSNLTTVVRPSVGDVTTNE